ncbi:kinase-like domain-containing protein [Suillus occidentalis]|nr:kinase-like domain-containing protein [Suillus occidentalis]
MTNGTLTSFLNQNNEFLSLHDRLLLLRDIAAGLDYLHTFSLTEDGHMGLNPVVHGDLTGTNVLIDGNRKAYLADFGLSGTFKRVPGMTYLAKLTGHPGALRWAAPELLFGEESDPAATTRSDMYSFGSIMLQVLTGKVPWYHLTRDFQISYQVVIEGKMHPRPPGVDITDQHWNFMTRCWSMTFTDRPLATEGGPIYWQRFVHEHELPPLDFVDLQPQATPGYSPVMTILEVMLMLVRRLSWNTLACFLMLS